MTPTKTYKVFVGKNSTSATKIRFKNGNCYYFEKKDLNTEKSVPIKDISAISERKISNSKTVGLSSIIILTGVLVTVIVVSSKI